MSTKDLNMTLLFDYYGEVLSDKQKEVMDLSYNEDMSLFEISEHVGITRQGVHDLIKRSEASLLALDEKLGLVSRLESVRASAKDLRDAVARLERLNEKYVFSRELSAVVHEIRRTLEKIEEAL